MKPHWLALTALLLASALAQSSPPAPLAPAGIPGETYLAPLGVPITVDGKFDDWAGVPRVTVTGGPSPARSPAEDGSLTFAAAADDRFLYLLATVPSANIVAGKHGTEYYKEDSVEFYLNVSGDLERKTYSPQVVQINFPAAGLDRPAADPLIGGGGAGLGIQAKVVRTPDGYAVEAALPHQNARWSLTPVHGGVIGFQAHLNGASATDRDTKLIWSRADVADHSYVNPSLFGKLIFFKLGEAALPATTTVLTAGPPAAVTPSLPPASATVQAAITALNLPAKLAPAHPRLLASAADFARLKELVASDPGARALFTRVEASAKGMLNAPVSTYAVSGVEGLLWTSRAVLTRAYTLGLTYRLTGDRTYADRLWKELVAAANFPDWNHRKHFLDTAEMAHAFAIGYDWLYDAWTPEQRQVIRDAIDRHALIPAIAGYRGRMDGDAFWVTAESNWGVVTHGGLGVAALAVGDALPEHAGEVLASALTNIRPALAGYLPDGGYAEGSDYWAYATQYAVALLGSLQSALGGDQGLLAAAPGLAKTGDFVMALAGPQYSFNYSDFPHPGTRVFAPEFRWLGRTFSNPAWDAYQNSGGGASPLDLLWYRQLPAGSGAASRPLDQVFPDTGVAVMRSAWNDFLGTFAGLKVGSNQAGHNDLDLGSFVFDALGTRWADELGRENYNVAGYWEYQPGGKRWMYYRKRAEGQNTLVINPNGQDDQDPRAQARITRSGSSADAAFAVTDLSAAYAGAGARKVERGVTLLDGRRQLLVQDEVELAAPGELWWFMHTSARAEVAPDGQSATLYRGTRRLLVRLLSPGGRLTLMDAAPLPGSPRMEGANPNMGLRKLAIHLQNFKSGRLAVLLTPLRPGEVAAAPPTVTPLAAWALPGASAAAPPAGQLTGLTVGGQALPDFVAGRLSYDVRLPATATGVPVVATTTPGARVTQAPGVPGTARVCPLAGRCTTVSFWQAPFAPEVGAGPLKVVSARASAQQDPNVPASAIDGDLQTRWAAEGPGQWLELDLGEARRVSGVGLRLGGSDVRLTSFDVLISQDGQAWTLAYAGENALGDPELQRYGFAPVQARYVRLVTYGNTVNDWNNVHEAQVYGR